jgi:ABC-type branched-subunit amino acid transport system substrate-binding protein/DNA-binding beta-propeller fold protein YncE
MKAAFTPGTTFAGYRVEALVGRGGMGVVYRATDLSLERPVALKLIAPELAQDTQFRTRFLREPRLAASLDHPNVIPIYEAGEHEGQLYLAMRYVEGTDLKSTRERDGKLTPARAIELLAQVASALDAAHERGLVHRDVKPGNVLIDRSEHVYLTDFGITKQTGADSTETGSLVGTLDYLAPEQIRGEPVDARTDCYALACVLYECLAGNPPFRRGTEAETLWGHMQDDPPPLRGQPKLDGVLRKGLAKGKDQRYPTCGALIEAAAAALGVAGPRSAARLPAYRRIRLQGALLAAGGLLLLVAAVAAGIAALGGEEDDDRGATIERAGAYVLDPATGAVEDAIPLGRAPAQIAIGEGAVWTLDANDRTISRIDPRDRANVRTFSTASTPTDLAAGAGAVWVGNASPSSRFASYPTSVSRLDPESGVVDATIRLPGGKSGPYFHGGGQSQPKIAVSEDAVWVVNPDHTISRIDPRTNRRVARIDDVRADSVAAGTEGVWVVEPSSDPFAAPGIARIDPLTNSVARRVEIRAESLTAVAVGAGSVWVADPAGGSVWRVNPVPELTLRQVPLRLGVRGVVFGAGRVWVTNEVTGTVHAIDPDTNRARSVARLAAPQNVAVGAGGVWLTALGAPSTDETLPASTCGDVFFRGGRTPRLLVVSDLPLQDPAAPAFIKPMAEGIRFVFERRGFRAGRHTVGYGSCDDSTAQAGGTDVSRCFANAKLYARTPDVVGVIGAFHSFCSGVEIPIANQAPDGPLAMISPSNTVRGLTRPYRGMPPGELEQLYPTGERNFVRIAAADHLAPVALVQTAKELRRTRLFVLWDGGDSDTAGFADDMRAAARTLGLDVVGAAGWDPGARHFARLARRVAGARPEAVLMAGAAPPALPAFLGDLRARLGRGPALIGSDGFAQFDRLRESGRAAQGMYVANYGIPNAKLPPAGRRLLAAAERPEDDGDNSFAYGAQAAEILLDAIARSDGTRASVTRELRATRVEDGILGDIRFDDNGDLVEGPFTIYRFIRKRPTVDRVVTVRATGGG